MIKRIMTSLLVVAALSLAFFAVPAKAIDVFPECSANPGSAICSAATKDKLFGVGSIWNRILETFTFIIGALSVLMIVIGGLRYVTSNGDQSAVTGAKNTILYSVIGLIISMLAYSIVHFVVSNI